MRELLIFIAGGCASLGIVSMVITDPRGLIAIPVIAGCLALSILLEDK